MGKQKKGSKPSPHLVADACDGCGSTLMYVAPKGAAAAAARCPQCWRDMLASSQMSASLQVTMVKGRLDAAIDRAATRRRSQLLNEMEGVSGDLGELVEAFARSAWAH